ncbi:LacI family DNA-binding transcriptional regulator [Amycolatopsis sp. NPDC021455]|uniref:LacI family DNA-binding transcriptional regulator n=1 Tax=Amycolatopsis sp. NPDC021455 TaxID=3154901 RepID=UPI0033EE43EF
MSEAGQPTIYDVARSAGVATSTVSRAFSRPGRVSAKTAARVRAVAAELGYRVAPLAGRPPAGRTATVALVVSDVTNPVYFGIVRAVETAAAAAGYTVLLGSARESDEVERAILERTLPTVDGVVLAGSRLPDRTIRTMAEHRAFVVLNRVVPGVRSIVPDTRPGIGGALHHLRGLGHRAVTYLAGPAGSWADGHRWRSILDLAPELGLKVSRIGPCAPTTEGGSRATPEVLRQASTAVLAYNDLLAIGLITGLAETGVRVPDQVSVVGFDDIFGADLCTPPLTTVAAPLQAMGARAFEELHQQLGGSLSRRRPMAPLPTRLVLRGSTLGVPA